MKSSLNFSAFLIGLIACLGFATSANAQYFNSDGAIVWNKSSDSDSASAGGGFGGFGWGSSGRSVTSFSKKYSPGTIVVSFGDRRLYHVRSRGRADSYPIAIPKDGKQWAGTYRVTRKQVNPGWTPTPQMRRENPKLPFHVKGGDRLNPLGSRALYVGQTLYRIHGTDAPWLIGKAVSRGCVRMHNADVNHLYTRTRVGARIVVTWKRFKG